MMTMNASPGNDKSHSKAVAPSRDETQGATATKKGSRFWSIFLWPFSLFVCYQLVLFVVLSLIELDILSIFTYPSLRRDSYPEIFTSIRYDLCASGQTWACPNSINDMLLQFRYTVLGREPPVDPKGWVSSALHETKGVAEVWNMLFGDIDMFVDRWDDYESAVPLARMSLYDIAAYIDHNVEGENVKECSYNLRVVADKAAPFVSFFDTMKNDTLAFVQDSMQELLFLEEKVHQLVNETLEDVQGVQQDIVDVVGRLQARRGSFYQTLNSSISDEFCIEYFLYVLRGCSGISGEVNKALEEGTPFFMPKSHYQNSFDDINSTIWYIDWEDPSHKKIYSAWTYVHSLKVDLDSLERRLTRVRYLVGTATPVWYEKYNLRQKLKEIDTVIATLLSNAKTLSPQQANTVASEV